MNMYLLLLEANNSSMLCIVPADLGNEHGYFVRATAVVLFLLIAITLVHLFCRKLLWVIPVTYVLRRQKK